MIWFISDIHFGHKRILEFHQERINKYGDTIEKHDEMLINYWNETIAKKDTVYIIGDLMFADQQRSRKILERLNGNKILILGNHDKVHDANKGYFNHITQIKSMKFKKTVFNFLSEDMEVVMCHFPMLTWEHKYKGVIMLHGHCHGKLDQYNTESKELRVDVGIDGKFSNYQFQSLEQIHEHMKKIAGDNTFAEYAKTLNIR